ncbi:MAG: hypothetical protein Q8P44_07195, partial [Dehalococcoidia bacterium]|nr:hypothetical protein [Dehalococcoidia bacterium]
AGMTPMALPYEGTLQREKQIKEWKRRWKIELIERENPEWRDLYKDILWNSGFRLSSEWDFGLIGQVQRYFIEFWIPTFVGMETMRVPGYTPMRPWAGRSCNVYWTE